MKLHLDFKPQPSPFQIDHQSKILLCGSCFSDNIGALLKAHQFNTLVNPQGLFFNPASLCESIDAIVSNKVTEADLIVKRDDVYVSYLHHSRIWAHDKESLVASLTEARNQSLHFLREADALVLTFGTSFVYSLKDTGRVVANCHKQPAQCFEKRMLHQHEIVEMYTDLIARLKTFNKNLKIIFTVSPVKYLKDGVQENVLSKATLCLAVNKIVCAHDNCFYFPAYELITEDLRDYRFYKEDLAHPNEQAIQYVWQKFAACYFSEATKMRNLEIDKTDRQLAHRPLYTRQPRNS